MGYIRLAIFGLVGLTVVYVLVSLYAASLRREALEDRWEAEGRPGDREAYVDRGMRAYRNSFRRKLIVLVYVIPIIAVTVLVYLLNFT